MAIKTGEESNKLEQIEFELLKEDDILSFQLKPQSRGVQDLLDLTQIAHLYLVPKTQVREWIKEEFSQKKKKQQRNDDFDEDADAHGGKKKVRLFIFIYLLFI